MRDPDVLALAASLGRIVVKHDVRTMPGHFGDFIAENDGPGLILIPRSMPIGRAIDYRLEADAIYASQRMSPNKFMAYAMCAPMVSTYTA